MKKTTFRLFHPILIFAMLLSACNLPSNNPEDIAATSAAATTQAALSATATLPATATAGSAPATLTPIPLPTNTSTPAPTATPTCPQAQFVTDVTIPDGTVMTPGQTFTKKWRIRNTGQCAWNGYTLVFDSGDSMSGPASQPIGVVNPGQEVDLEVNLTAPSTAGNYRGYWRIVSNANVLVPMLNGYQGRAFYVDIKVQAPPTATHTSAPAFAVTSVSFEVTGTCPNFHVKVSVTTNAAGTVKYKFVSQDGSSTSLTDLVFASAGTKIVEYDRYFGVPASSLWTDMYVDQPNNQQFGRATLTCP
ncbi:MAG: hypothetical protein HXY38_11435 [Chloroflexi bacterium]|nr:hypothetical protein [Chloroflexota bacterium]